MDKAVNQLVGLTKSNMKQEQRTVFSFIKLGLRSEAKITKVRSTVHTKQVLEFLLFHYVSIPYRLIS